MFSQAVMFVMSVNYQKKNIGKKEKRIQMVPIKDFVWNKKTLPPFICVGIGVIHNRMYNC